MYIYQNFLTFFIKIFNMAQYTLEQYTILTEAISTGTTKVTYGDKTVEYRSLNEMLRIQKIMKNDLFPEQNKNNGRRYASFSKGL